MVVGIIGAMKVEITRLLECMEIDKRETISLIDFFHGRIDGHSVILTACGPGKVNAAVCTQTMIVRYAPDIIINTGTAGSLSPSLGVGDLAIASAVVQYDIDTTALGDPRGLVSGIDMVEFTCDPVIIEKLIQSVDSLHSEVGIIATGDRFLGSIEEKQEILRHFNAIACEMESASIGQVCYMNQVPFGIIRSISDNADQESCMDYAEFLEMAASRAASMVRIFLEKIDVYE